MGDKIDPIRRSEFGLSAHRYQSFDVEISSKIDRTKLTDPALWVNVAPSIRVGDEIRVRTIDDSFYARLYCTYSYGSAIRLHTLYTVNLDGVDRKRLDDENCDYEIKQRGIKKWCILNKSTGEVMEEMIPTQGDANKRMQELIKILRM